MELESLFLIEGLKEELGKLPDFDTYNMSDNHCKAREFCNDVPVMRIDIRSSTWDIEDVEDNDMEFICQQMWEDFECFCEWIEEDEGIEIFTDMNGYRVLLGSDVYKQIETAQEMIEELNELQLALEKEKDEDEIERLNEEIDSVCYDLDDVYNNLKEGREQVEKFLKLEQRIKDWVKDYPKDYMERKKEMEE